MSEQINKVLASTVQSFSTAEQAQARANIGAAPSGDYAYNSALSAKQDSSAMSAYLPYSAISADASSAITSINGSSIGSTGGACTGCYAGHYITGDGSSGSPLGLDSYAVFESANSSNSVGRRGMTVMTTGSLGKTAWYYAAFASLEDSDGNTANYRAKYADYNNGVVSGRVDASSIYSWNHPNYYCIVRTPAASTTNVVTTASYPTGLTSDARLDIVHLGDTSYSYVVYDKNSSGATKSITAGQVGTVWWVATASSWNSF